MALRAPIEPIVEEIRRQLRARRQRRRAAAARASAPARWPCMVWSAANGPSAAPGRSGRSTPATLTITSKPASEAASQARDARRLVTSSAMAAPLRLQRGEAASVRPPRDHLASPGTWR